MKEEEVGYYNVKHADYIRNYPAAFLLPTETGAKPSGSHYNTYVFSMYSNKFTLSTYHSSCFCSLGAPLSSLLESLSP